MLKHGANMPTGMTLAAATGRRRLFGKEAFSKYLPLRLLLLPLLTRTGVENW